MTEIDPFSRQRLIRFIGEHRRRTGQLPTLTDLEREGFTKTFVNLAVRKKILNELYVTLTNGTVMKGYGCA